MRLGRIFHAQVFFWLTLGVLIFNLPTLAQLPGAPVSIAPIALEHGWQYQWDDRAEPTVPPPPWSVDQPWTEIAIPKRLPTQGNFLWLAIPLPQQSWQSPALYFQGLPKIIAAYVNGQVIYTQEELDTNGKLLHREGAFPVVPIPHQSQGEMLFVRLYTAGDVNIPLAYEGLPRMGEQSALIRILLIRESPRIALGFLFIFCGLFPLIIALFRNPGEVYISFGLVALLIGIYTLTPAQLIRLLFAHSIYWTYLHHLTFHLLPVSICIFFEHIFGIGPGKIVRRLWQIHLLYAPIAIGLAGTQLLSWGQAALPTQFMSLVSAIVLIVLSWHTAHKGNQEAKIFTLGFSLFLSFVIYDLIVYLRPDHLWSIQLYIWGMLVFLIGLAFILERRFTNAQNHLKAYNKASDRFVPHEFLTLLGKSSIIDVQLGDQVQKEMTVLFSDIRSFTSLSESMTPERNFNFLNAYLECVSPVIREHNGFIDKYIGDAIMALFPKSSADAIRAAIAMQHQLSTFNEKIAHQGYPAINIGIGLHRGSLMLGTIGEQQRMETTVIADAVNLASRLEESTKKYGARLVISRNTLYELPDPEQFAHRFLGRILVKGKKESIEICEIYEADPEPLKAFKTATRNRFEAAIELHDRGELEAARQIFEVLWQENPEDKVVRICLLRCKLI